MKNFSFLSLAFLILLTHFLFGQSYDAAVGSPNPTAQGWLTSEVVLGADGNGDGLIDGGANVGPATGGGDTAWQISDQLGAISRADAPAE
ncbi:MAG: hypothetical protein P1U90_14330 [Akkermansiaceae bacterium]|jgi:hypothetical protein|nr:hypothetical protein [Akkermansiaceae bacterium]